MYNIIFNEIAICLVFVLCCRTYTFWKCHHVNACNTCMSSVIASHVTTDDHWRAEVLWAMKVVSSHYSYVSCMETDRLFQLMFPDSTIAKSFSCGEKKSAYIICHGLAPYFSQQLKDQVRLLDSFVILFELQPLHSEQTDGHTHQVL